MFKLLIEEEIEKCTDDDDASEDTELFHTWLKYCFEDIGCDEKFETEKKIDTEAISDSIVCRILWFWPHL